MVFLRYLLPTAIGVGLVVGTGYLFNRGYFELPGQTIRVPFKPSRSLSIRVPTYLVPQLIGKKGQKIHDLEAATKTSIHFDGEIKFDQDLDMDVLQEGDRPPNTSDRSSANNNDWIDEPLSARTKRSAYLGHRVMHIRGDDEGLRQVEAVVNQLIQENEVESVLIPDGCNIVGVGGETINRIADYSGAKIKVEGNQFTTNRMVLVIGNPNERDRAKSLIHEVFDEHYKSQRASGH